MERNYSYWNVAFFSENRLSASSCFSNRFENDKLFYEDVHCVLIIDGVLLNKNELFDTYDISTLKELLFLVLDDINLAKSFVGPFTVFIYNKDRKQGFAFGNQTGDASVFYAMNQNKVAYLSNNFTCIADVRKNNFLDEEAAHYLLTYGFLIGNHTIVSDIKRLGAGEYIEISSESFAIKRYHRLDFSQKEDMTINEACDKLDVLFRRAVKRCFDKDLEYGYKRHLVDLSAGLDSRMTNWVAKELGYNDITNISYSQGGSDEDVIVRQLIKVLGNKYFYRPLDDITFLYDIDSLVEKEFGFAYYCGITGGWDFLNLIDFDNFGLEHTGQIGDAVISTIVNNASSNTINLNIKRNSNLLKLRYSESIDVTKFKTQEEFVFYSRLAQGALSTHYIRANYTYAVSPFMDVDLLEFCARIPDEIRDNHRLYWYWIDKKYPTAGIIPSSRIRNITKKDKFYSLLKRGRLKMYRILQYLLYITGISKTGTISNNMNPHTFWIETNKELFKFVEKQYNSNKELLDDFPILQEEVLTMVNSNNGLDKLMAISMLATIKRYCKK